MKNPILKIKEYYMKLQIGTVGADANKVTKPTTGAFTIVESLVAISILVIAVLGPIVIISQALRTSFFARDQMTAYYLAQESIEHIRNLRDRNSFRNISASEWLQEMTYLSGVLETAPALANASTPAPQKYSLVRTAGGYKLEACPSNTCALLNVNVDNGTYGETGAGNLKPSIYTREITFHEAPGDSSGTHEIAVEVLMKWAQTGGMYQFKLRENLTNWKIQSFSN